MCGIFGAFLNRGIEQERFEAATNSMAHRGPDAAAYYTDPNNKNIFLGHRRLSIIDLNSTANQPMHSADGRYVIVYNGELYNFKLLKEKIPHFVFKTQSDTELIVELFAVFGVEVFAWFKGIFALAIYDTLEQQLFLCRDQLGIKPLYIQRAEGKLIFASELKALVQANKSINSKLESLQVSKKAVAHFLHLGFIPEPLSIYRGIKKFPAGHYAVFDLKTQEWKRQCYWDIKKHYLNQPYQNATEITQLYKEKLFNAVASQMISDVPLGTFLSGGIDSSLVSAVASKVATKPIQAFSIGFNEEQYDESVYAAKIAKELNIAHHIFKVGIEDVFNLMPDLMQTYDEPFADSSAFPTMLVSKMAKEHVTVTLSGDGGDEFYQGYGMYQWAERLNDWKLLTLRKPYVWLSKYLNDRHQRAAKVFDFPKATHLRSHIFSQEQYLFSEQELKHLLRKNRFDFSAINPVIKKGTAREQQAYWDILHYLKDDLLVKVDRASMRYSLETRVPLLDQDLIEFSLNVPLQYKLDDTYGTKALMKKTLFEMLPQQLFDRPKKGFSIPLQQWLKKELKPLVDKYLSKQRVEYGGMVEYEQVALILKAFYSGKQYLYNRVWALLVLHWWYFEKDTNL